MSQILPPIPDKHYFTIGEVAHLCQLKPYVLRYWEEEFPQLSPMKRRGNRRYYRYQDVELIRYIRHLLYERGFTINGAIRELAAGKKQRNVAHYTQVVADTIVELENLLEDIAS